MKTYSKIYTALLLVYWLAVGSAEIGAQNGDSVEWAPQGAKWWYMYNVGLSGNETTYTMEVVGDTTIQNVRCKILRQELVEFHTGDVVHVTDDFIYQSRDTVFYYSRGLREFSILYNFDTPLNDSFAILEPGDPYSADSSLLAWKMEQDTIILENQAIRRYTSRSDLSSSNWVLFGSIYEVFGNVDAFFLPLYDLGCDGGCPLKLRCYKDDKFDLNFGMTPCDFVTSTIFQDKKNDVIIYPNPAKSFFFHSPTETEIEEINPHCSEARNREVQMLKGD
ncbi:MAG: hypothetical protein IPL46_30480 [Saprospiraceae bacterium]|nr:hypothetical protein [Saprospiraceae bacterium]